jgi:hypothetical protein
VGSLGVPCSTATCKVVWNQHFSEADFTSSECIHLNRMVLPTVCATSSYKEVQCGVSATVLACDIKMFSVAYVSDFIAGSCDMSVVSLPAVVTCQWFHCQQL